MVQETHAPSMDEEPQRRKIINRLRRLEGQVRGISSMIDSDKECEAVLTQVMAAKSALNQVGMHVIGHAMKTCLIDDTLSERDALISAAFGVYLHYRDLGGSTQPEQASDLTSPAQLVARLRDLESQIHAVQDAVSAHGDCETALRELTAATTTLNQVGLAVLGRAMHRCLIDETVTSRDEVIDQAIQVFLRYSSCVR